MPLDAALETYQIYDEFFTKLKIDNQVYECNAVDMYACLEYYRLLLEKQDTFILCYGSRIDTYPSGMLRDMSGGFRTYLLVWGELPTIVVNLLDYSDEKIGTVKEQKDYYDKWRADIKRKL